MKNKINNETLLVAGLAIAFFSAFYIYAILFPGPAYLSDEIGYLTKAAALAGRSIDFPSSWHGGYSLILSPLFFFLDNHSIVWRSVQAINALLFSGAFVLLFKILTVLLPQQNKKVILVTSLVTMLYPSWVVMSAYAFSTPAIVFFNCLSLYLLLNIKKGPHYVIFSGVTTGFLYWIHPTGIVAILAGAISYILLGIKTKNWSYLVLYLVASIFLAAVYKLVFHPFLQGLMAADGFAVNTHYPELESVLKSLIDAGFWKTFPFMLTGQILSALISTFGSVGFAFIHIFKTVKDAQNVDDSVQMQKSFAYAFMSFSMIGTLLLGALSFSLADHGSRADIWIYSRYVDPFLFPLIAVGIFALRERKIPLLIIPVLALLLFCFLYIFGNIDATGNNNLVNIPSFWPYAIFPDKSLYYWLVTGIVGLICFSIVSTKLQTLMAIPLIVLSAYVASEWHSRILSHYSEPDPVIDLIENNFEKGTCIAFDAAPRERGMPERRNLLAFYLYEYDFRRFYIHDWKEKCNGLFLTQRALDELPVDTVIVATNSQSGLSVLTHISVANQMDFTSLEETGYFYDASGAAPCLKAGCLVLRPADLARFTKIGELGPNGLSNMGRNGFLFYGPYASLPSGDYELQIDMESTDDVKAVVDVTSNSGKHLHGEAPITGLHIKNRRFVMTFSLDKAVDNFEARLRVSDGSDLSIQSLRISPINSSAENQR